ncbi:Plasmodium exported protein, unknown function [Plasmodium berghei]|uniref:Plasmodium RESA N-terminal domain-containing protein n=2 Tax=Plasmodium berghei TaxID=5821 RepID=A0A509AEW6_PLABA|nr:Plasmodium exported protein, unknown function [Plasmodium berghei ANKA]CXH85270.1 Plasmodium exported protein, unknown function [Plasmodium berghei]SCL89843.1 Plasmodium exported protein, unknown function [Plasmodium berghei]SCM15165.1 Plasmodium exported protein, unknown function [Plasmodium berghei]SCM16960.1 Plasmodium exported protein, unknown function [Plasmodium berghei]SCN21766.1 Plasmodium exported protein, unknown function [Plasmodium berghei]|eukprot:XP_034419741.1 Plasmodium exported protein, unknown function [Plasmodium berghei ANKA]
MEVHKFMLSIISLLFVYWKTSHYYRFKCIGQCFDENDFYKLKNGKRFARILQVEDINIFEIYENAQHQEGTHQEIMEPPSLNNNFINSNVSSDINEDAEMVEYITFIIDTFNKVFLTMFELYHLYTNENNITDNQWKYMMWNDIWYKYLEILISRINENTQSPSYSMENIQPIIHRYMFKSIEDFSVFLEIIQNEWELKLRREERAAEIREPETEVSESESNIAEINE